MGTGACAQHKTETGALVAWQKWIAIVRDVGVAQLSMIYMESFSDVSGDTWIGAVTAPCCVYEQYI